MESILKYKNYIFWTLYERPSRYKCPLVSYIRLGQGLSVTSGSLHELKKFYINWCHCKSGRGKFLQNTVLDPNSVILWVRTPSLVQNLALNTIVVSPCRWFRYNSMCDCDECYSSSFTAWYRLINDDLISLINIASWSAIAYRVTFLVEQRFFLDFFACRPELV